MKGGDTKRSRSHIVGIIALVFLIIGYQTAVLLHKSIRTAVLLGDKQCDTVYILIDSNRFYSTKDVSKCKSVAFDVKESPKKIAKQNKILKAKDDIKKTVKREYKTFRFNPNTVSVTDLISLGFSKKQAESIDNYRNKGGKFLHKKDFKKSYVVSDSIYRRLEPYIDIPLLDLNDADSVNLVKIRGIGPFLSSCILKHRDRLGGFTSTKQLLDIKYIDEEKFASISDYITVTKPFYFKLWEASKEKLQLHPYIGKKYCQSVVNYIENNDKSRYNWKDFKSANLMSEEDYLRLKLCVMVED